MSTRRKLKVDSVFFFFLNDGDSITFIDATVSTVRFQEIVALFLQIIAFLTLSAAKACFFVFGRNSNIYGTK